MRVCLVFNPSAGTAERVKDFLVHLTGKDRWEIRVPSDDAALRELADEIREGEYDRVAVGGGDGSINRIVQALAPDFPETPISVLPFGTGNDLARSLGYSANEMEEALRCTLEGATVRIDVVRWHGGDEDGWCVNVANGGFGGRVARDVTSDDKGRWGQLAYWTTGLGAVVEADGYEVRLEIDGETTDERVAGLAVANGRYVGGGFPIAREALLDDGLLHVTAVRALPRLELLATGMNYLLGRNGSDEVRTYTGRSVSVTSVPDLPFSIDGEAVQEFDAHFEVLERVLHVVRGPGEAALVEDREARERKRQEQREKAEQEESEGEEAEEKEAEEKAESGGAAADGGHGGEVTAR
ncbi:MAG: diacylglycerol kinase family lipid kinase [Acidobacteria bacterium]|nr:MAG: diacylglycerol kinase family lipid kinase [Acidobacteriota bacterium]REK09147.1 MAG: diacylglycerol kinase family lipid kinase [Acidobacteriota bacterium]